LHYHLIGIGGAGMSAIAQILHQRGETVSGSDRQANDATRRLSAAGVRVAIGHAPANLDGADLVVYSAAIPTDNVERVEAEKRGIKQIERSEMLGALMQPYACRIAVAGTHGKTTTTSMISAVLDVACVEATVLVGGDVASLGGNARLGNGSIFLTEACEAYGSFLHLKPSIAVVTNVDADHLDHYGTAENVEAGFAGFLSGVDQDGCVIACGDDERAWRLAGASGRRALYFGFASDSHVTAESVDVSSLSPSFTLSRDGVNLGRIKLGVPGTHNVYNALAAAAVAFELGIDFEDVREALGSFCGVRRRFEILYDDGGVTVIDDYAHHPNEIKATLSAARSACDSRIVAVFQPHLYSRTRLFAHEFAEALALADEVVLAPIYAAREKPIPGVTSNLIADQLVAFGYESFTCESDKAGIAASLALRVRPGDMVMVIGAGDIRTVGEELASILKDRSIAT